MKKILLVAAALTFAAATLPASNAHACGGYDVPTPEQRAAQAVRALLAKHHALAAVQDLQVDLFDGRRGEATVVYKKGGSIQLGLLNQDGRWKVVRHQPRPAPATACRGGAAS